MKLYCFPPSPNSWKVRAVAAHLDVPLDVEFVDPTGRTPTLVDDDFKLCDFKLWESNAIMQYVASRKPNSPLAGRRPDARRHNAVAERATRALEQGGDPIS